MATKSIPVYFDERMVARCALPSPSPRKPELVVARWRSLGLPIRIEPVAPVSRAEFNLAHERSHVDGIFAGTTANGFGTHDREVMDSLAWTSGSMLSAARAALLSANDPTSLVRGVACSPTSGFHHAGWAQSWGFCTFNGLMITCRKILLEGKVKRIGILDCDQHHGDGTEDIITHLGLHGSVEHITARTGYPHDATIFMKTLPDLLKRFAGCGLLLYQAGADCHVDDPLGGFLDSAQMRLRDRLVFEHCARAGLPVAWNLAGGYQQEERPDGSVSLDKVLALHDATMEECIRVFAAA